MDGKLKTVRSDATKLGEVIAVTLMALVEDRCSGRVLRRLAGLWVHHLLCRRPYLCLLDTLFAEAETENRRPWKATPLTAALRDELLMCCLLACDAQVSLETPYFPVVSATDASLHHGAVVETVCDLPTVAWLCSRASLRGAYSNGVWPVYRTPG